MKKQKGFTLIELLIVVAIIGIIAAIAIPGLLRAKIAANEAAAIGDSRTVNSALQTYAAGNSNLYVGEPDFAKACLADPTQCTGGGPGGKWAGTGGFLDAVMNPVGVTEYNKQGYHRSYHSVCSPKSAPCDGFHELNSADSFVYVSDPIGPGQTGTRYFIIDASGVICQAGTASYTPGFVDPNGMITDPALCAPGAPLGK